MNRTTWLPIVALGAAIATGCDDGRREAPTPDRARSAAAPAQARVEFVKAPREGDVAELVKSELARAQRDGRVLLVYVGAPWCEPCRRFHEAADAGKLDGVFPGLRLLEFDHDVDEARLAAAGFVSRMIPLFAIPGPDGRGTGKQIAGSVKGEGAVAEITPRLLELLAQAPKHP